MKKRLLASLLAGTMILAGCAQSSGLETDTIKISNYKGVEVAAVEKPAEITDEDVDAEIKAKMQTLLIIQNPF